jgi:uncharacterized protein YecE (DUF72 family)
VRYDYLYSEKELIEFVPGIREISKKVAKTLIFFNNCYSGSAAKNAAQMAKLLMNEQGFKESRGQGFKSLRVESRE